MPSRDHRADELLVPSNFIRAMREAGYLSTAAAIAELVDNSLQASASDIEITIKRDSPDSLPEIVVTDNGAGMSRGDLEACLRFGGTSRFDGRASFGRFGMGLPAASLSQARHVEVTAWRSGGREWAVNLDVDAVAAGERPSLIAQRGMASASASGCRVRWTECDRIEYRRLAWLERSLRRDLGRMYRRFLTAGVKLTINGMRVEPIDPTFLSAAPDGAVSQLAIEELRYELTNHAGELSWVTVRFAILPIEEWYRLDNATKRRMGIVNAGTVSIMRAGREIANGWHLMGTKRKENYDDWWRCEVEFEPTLDEHFGITINKQGIRPSPTLRRVLEPDLEAIARSLNARVRQTFEDLKFRLAANASCQIAAAADPYLPVLPSDAGAHGGGPLQYKLSTDQFPPDELFMTSLKSNTLEVKLNVDHPAFHALYAPLQAMIEGAGPQLRTALELLLLSLARALALEPESTGRLLSDLGATYGRMLQSA